MRLLRATNTGFNLSRWRLVLATLMLASGAIAQTPRTAPQKSAPHALRALAVVEFISGKPVKLEPVTIFTNGDFQDATLYQAGPVPMALEPGTQYEVQREGVPQGLFTIQQPEQEKDAWYAKGRWTTQSQIAAAEAAKAAQAKAAEARKPRPLILEKDDRPVLRRAPKSESEPASPPPAPTTASTTSASAPSSTPSQTQTDNSQAIEARAPERPVLRRRETRGEQVSATEKVSRAAASKVAPSPASEKSVANAAIWGTAGAPEELVAVSDAVPSDQHPYKFSWTPDEQATLTKKMGELAQRELQKYVAQRGLALADAKNWQSVNVRAFDLYYDNDAELVFTGVRAVRKAAAAGARRGVTRPTQAADPSTTNAYATLIAYMDSSSELHICKFDATDDGQLDVSGHLRLIDAVDATGDTRGELFFRRVGRGSSSYELYRVYPDSVYQLFDSAHPLR